jgi:hypothetical protein
VSLVLRWFEDEKNPHPSCGVALFADRVQVAVPERVAPVTASRIGHDPWCTKKGAGNGAVFVLPNGLGQRRSLDPFAARLNVRLGLIDRFSHPPASTGDSPKWQGHKARAKSSASIQRKDRRPPPGGLFVSAIIIQCFGRGATADAFRRELACCWRSLLGSVASAARA